VEPGGADGVLLQTEVMRIWKVTVVELRTRTLTDLLSILCGGGFLKYNKICITLEYIYIYIILLIFIRT
jgi:hypothetical protein